MTTATLERTDAAWMAAEIARLRCKLAGVPDDQTLALAEWFGLRPASAKVVAALLKANGRTLSVQRLIGAVGNRTTREAIMVHICEARAAMEPGAVLTVTGLGYRLSAPGLAECRRAVEQQTSVRS